MNSFIKRQSALIVATLALLFAAFVLGVPYAHAQASSVTSTMGPGSSGASVTALQVFLATDRDVYPEGLVTGFYGPLTTAAVQRFQCTHEIMCQGDVASTGYGRVGPITLGVIQGSTSLPHPITGGDVSAPVMSTSTVTVTSTSATFHWTTNERATSAVLYGAAWPFSLGTAPTVFDGTMDLSSDITVTGLRPNTVYFYVLQSLDASGNVQYDIGKSFRTAP